jgi:HEAT repeat protein
MQYKSPEIRSAVERFLEDVNEAVRFSAAAATYAQEDAGSVAVLLKTLVGEESIRVRNRIAEGLVARGWAIPMDAREEAKKTLPPGFVIDAQGLVRRR